MKNNYHIFTLALFSLFFAETSFAQLHLISNLTVTPTQPGPSDQFTITSEIYTGTQSTPISTFQIVDIPAKKIYLTSCYHEIGGLPMQWIETYTFTPLPVGVYQVYRKIYQSFDSQACDKNDSTEKILSIEIVDLTRLFEDNAPQPVVYPNPLTDHTLRITGINTKAVITICSLTGAHLLTESLYGAGEINMTAVGSGIYFLTIETSDATWRKKIIVP